MTRNASRPRRPAHSNIWQIGPRHSAVGTSGVHIRGSYSMRFHMTISKAKRLSLSAALLTGTALGGLTLLSVTPSYAAGQAISTYVPGGQIAAVDLSVDKAAIGPLCLGGPTQDACLLSAANAKSSTATIASGGGTPGD